MNPNATPSRRVIAVENFNGVWCDAWTIDQEQLVFASLWGRSSRILALYGAITARPALTSAAAVAASVANWTNGKPACPHNAVMAATSCMS